MLMKLTENTHQERRKQARVRTLQERGLDSHYVRYWVARLHGRHPRWDDGAERRSSGCVRITPPTR
jgi:hypothetical protein